MRIFTAINSVILLTYISIYQELLLVIEQNFSLTSYLQTEYCKFGRSLREIFHSTWWYRLTEFISSLMNRNKEKIGKEIILGNHSINGESKL